MRRQIELLQQSAGRLMRSYAAWKTGAVADKDFWRFMRREIRQQVRLSIKLWWMARRKRG